MAWVDPEAAATVRDGRRCSSRPWASRSMPRSPPCWPRASCRTRTPSPTRTQRPARCGSWPTWSTAGAPLSAHQSRHLRRQAVLHARAVGPDADTASGSGGTAGSCTPRRPSRCSPRPAAEPTATEGFVDLLASTKDGRHHRPVQGDRGVQRARQRPHHGARRCGGHHLGLRGRWPRPCGRLLAGRAARRGGGAASSRSASGSSTGPMLGVVNLDKPVGPTSHDMVGLLRRLTGTRRIGHAGTLDPLAVGRPAHPRRGGDPA